MYLYIYTHIEIPNDQRPAWVRYRYSVLVKRIQPQSWDCGTLPSNKQLGHYASAIEQNHNVSNTALPTVGRSQAKRKIDKVYIQHLRTGLVARRGARHAHWTTSPSFRPACG